MDHRTLDDILAPYERREVLLTAHEIAERRAGLMLGWQLNRLQGATMDEADHRLVDLYATGRIKRDEYGLLVVKIAEAEQNSNSRPKLVRILRKT